jgi:hypothetical protein
MTYNSPTPLPLFLRPFDFQRLSVLVIDLATDVDASRVQLAPNAVGRQTIGDLVPDALVTQRGQVEVVGGSFAGGSQADQFGAIGTGLPVVLGEVGVEVHAPRYTP